MRLGKLIEALEAADPEHVAPLGFGAPMSFRGYYEDVAFEPAKNVTVASMLKNAKDALGATFKGYKGGEFKMHEYTDCWICEYGTSYMADKIGATLIAYITGRLQ